MQTGARTPSGILVLVNPQPILNDPYGFPDNDTSMKFTSGNYVRWGLTTTSHLAIGFSVGKPHTTDLEYQRTITKNHERFSHSA